MQKLTAILFFFFVAHSVAQNDSKFECGFYGKKNELQRSKMFPFDNTNKILFIAYPNNDDIVSEIDGVEKPHDSITYSLAGMKILREFKVDIEGRKDTFSATEMVTLDKLLTDELSNLLFNFKFKNKNENIVEPTCFLPRNAVLFLDKDDNVISYVMICFECEEFYMFPDKYQVNDLALRPACDERIKHMKILFEKVGIKFGVKARF